MQNAAATTNPSIDVVDVPVTGSVTATEPTASMVMAYK
jgi:hypothetical protein